MGLLAEDDLEMSRSAEVTQDEKMADKTPKKASGDDAWRRKIYIHLYSCYMNNIYDHDLSHNCNDCHMANMSYLSHIPIYILIIYHYRCFLWKQLRTRRRPTWAPDCLRAALSKLAFC